MQLPRPTAAFKPTPAGTFPAICYRVIDLGTQESTYKGKPRKAHMIMLSWEIHDDECKTDDGRPMSHHQRYTWSTNEKAMLRKHLASWRGKDFTEADFAEGGFDIKTLIGKPCLLTITHKEKDGSVYANMTGVSRLPKGMTPPKQSNESLYLALVPGLFNPAALEKLSENMQEVIKKSPEYKYLTQGGQSQSSIDDDDDDDDELPF